MPEQGRDRIKGENWVAPAETRRLPGGREQEVEREVEEAEPGGRKRKRRVHAVEYCHEPELEGARPCRAPPPGRPSGGALFVRAGGLRRLGAMKLQAPRQPVRGCGQRGPQICNFDLVACPAECALPTVSARARNSLGAAGAERPGVA